MSWEQRGTKRYYYRTRRVGGKVVRQYFGSGEEAQRVAAEDQRKHERRLLVRSWIRDMREMRQLGRLRLKVLRIVRTALALHEQDLEEERQAVARRVARSRCFRIRATPGNGAVSRSVAPFAWPPAADNAAVRDLNAWRSPVERVGRRVHNIAIGGTLRFASATRKRIAFAMDSVFRTGHNFHPFGAPLRYGAPAPISFPTALAVRLRDQHNPPSFNRVPGATQGAQPTRAATQTRVFRQRSRSANSQHPLKDLCCASTF